jgi:AraC-like DNA-binding protein
MEMKDNELIHNFLFSCKKEKIHNTEQVAPAHVLMHVVSGKVEFQFDNEIYTARPDDILIIHRNRFVKATKIPDDSKTPCQTINIGITQEYVRNIALQKNIGKQERYTGKSLVVLSKDKFMPAFFVSLLPYLEKPEKMSDTMAGLKTAKAIELLLATGSVMDTFLFDWNEPHKIDLEKFINQNFMFNVPLSEFARLSGRSLSTFQRDFKKIFADTPENWLRNRRLEEARRLITHEGKKPSEIFYRVGFENFSHFSTAYKEKFGWKASEAAGRI